tara:strand:+ start:194 stop:376 length:183 start_codon:yes stop_codon:yes gene_type:complete
MKVGDLVQHCFHERLGVIIKEVDHPSTRASTNKVFDVAWLNGTTGYNIWNYNLEKVNESR